MPVWRTWLCVIAMGCGGQSPDQIKAEDSLERWERSDPMFSRPPDAPSATPLPRSRPTGPQLVRQAQGWTIQEAGAGFRAPDLFYVLSQDASPAARARIGVARVTGSKDGGQAGALSATMICGRVNTEGHPAALAAGDVRLGPCIGTFRKRKDQTWSRKAVLHLMLDIGRAAGVVAGMYYQLHAADDVGLERELGVCRIDAKGLTGSAARCRLSPAQHPEFTKLLFEAGGRVLRAPSPEPTEPICQAAPYCAVMTHADKQTAKDIAGMIVRGAAVAAGGTRTEREKVLEDGSERQPELRMKIRERASGETKGAPHFQVRRVPGGWEASACYTPPRCAR